jgi:hypothetical protein
MEKLLRRDSQRSPARIFATVFVAVLSFVCFTLPTNGFARPAWKAEQLFQEGPVTSELHNESMKCKSFASQILREFVLQGLPCWI